MNLEKVFGYYSRPEVQEALLTLAREREVVGVTAKGSFGERPNILSYPRDITEMVRSGMVEFNCSLERWSNPMALRPDNYQKLRKGWDLVLDIDCREFEHARAAALSLIKNLQNHGLRNVSVKFTGGKGFHLGIPWESFPDEINRMQVSGMFPELPRIIGLYLKEQTREDLGRRLIKLNSPEELAGISGKPLGSMLTDEGLDPYQIVEIDPVLISSRHLFRMAYSLNAKSSLVSLPVKPQKLGDFEKEMARPERVKVGPKFLSGGEEEASDLVLGALDWWRLKKERERVKKRRENIFKKGVPLEMMPPCFHNIMAGIKDGRKRSVFIIINLLASLKWPWPEIEKLLLEWNSKNSPPLNENYIKGQLRWAKGRKALLPPNCTHEGWYLSFGVCVPDQTCGGESRNVKNPVNYPFRKMEFRKARKRKRN